MNIPFPNESRELYNALRIALTDSGVFHGGNLQVRPGDGETNTQEYGLWTPGSMDIRLALEKWLLSLDFDVVEDQWVEDGYIVYRKGMYSMTVSQVSRWSFLITMTIDTRTKAEKRRMARYWLKRQEGMLA